MRLRQKNANEFIRLYKDSFFEMLDSTYAEIYGTVPFTEKMKDELVKSFKQIIDVRYIAMVLDKDEKPVCFGLCFPSIARAVQKSGGRMTLPTLFRILKAVKKPEIIDLALIGVPEKNTVPYTFAFVETAGKSEAVSGRTYRAKAGESLWDYAYFTGVSIDRLAENNRHIACIAALKDGEEVHVP